MTVLSQQEPILNGSSKIQSLTRNSPKQMLFSIVNGKTEHILSRDKLTKPQSYRLSIHLNNIQAHNCTQLNKALRHIKAHNIQGDATAFTFVLIPVKIQTWTHSQTGILFTQGHIADHGAVIGFLLYLAVFFTFTLWLAPRQQRTEFAQKTRLAALVQLMMPVHSVPIVHLRIWEQKQGVVSCHPRSLPVKG